MIQTVDREKILEKIANYADILNKTPYPMLIQVNFPREDTKYGCNEQTLAKLVDLLMSSRFSSKIAWQGIMTMIPLSATTFDEKLVFCRNVHSVFKEYQQNYPNCTELSMGMSNSFEEAILAGATMIRIGTALFGE
jgi:hypothetical protein